MSFTPRIPYETVDGDGNRIASLPHWPGLQNTACLAWEKDKAKALATSKRKPKPKPRRNRRKR